MKDINEIEQVVYERMRGVGMESMVKVLKRREKDNMTLRTGMSSGSP